MPHTVFPDREIEQTRVATAADAVRTRARAAATSASVESPPKSPSLQDLVDTYAGDLPKTAWVCKLHLETPRQNLQCLPLTFRFVKRAFDIIGAVALVLLCSPILVTAAMLVKLTSPGPVIYRQTRVGLNLRKKKGRDRRQDSMAMPPDQAERRSPGRDRREQGSFGQLFTIYKFRTMRDNAEEWGPKFATRGDSRITPIGRFLRRTRIDELPQLWNVLKGEMSLVGPRPERPEFMEELSGHIPNFIDRLGLKPGLTGIAQVVNGYDNQVDGFRRKAAYDLLYLQNCCLLNDLRILARTMRVVITGEGAL